MIKIKGWQQLSNYIIVYKNFEMECTTPEHFMVNPIYSIREVADGNVSKKLKFIRYKARFEVKDDVNSPVIELETNERDELYICLKEPGNKGNYKFDYVLPWRITDLNMRSPNTLIAQVSNILSD